MRRNRIAIAVCGGMLLGVTSMSGGVDAAKCGGQPDGIVDLAGGPESGTWDSPGEVVSFITTNLGSEVLRDGGPPGQLVKLLCAGPNVPG